MEKKNQLEKYRKQIASLSREEQTLRDLNLREFALGNLQGPLTGFPTLDKTWLKYYSAEGVNHLYNPIKAIDFLKLRNINNGDSIAMKGIEGIFTYNEMFNMIDDTAKAMYYHGIKRGDKIYGYLPPIAHENFILYGADTIGCALSFATPGTPTEEICATINKFEMKAFFVFEDFLSKELEDEIYATTNIDNIVVIGFRNQNYKNPKTVSWNAYLDAAKGYEMPNIKTSPYDVLFLAKTGGTTGKPKNVMISSNSFNVIADQFIHSNLPYESQDKWLRIWPLFSATAAISSNHLPLSMGMELNVMGFKDPSDIDKITLATKPNHIILAPIFLDFLEHSKLLENEDLSYVKTCGYGGTSMASTSEEKALKFFHEHNANIFMGSGWGFTEISSVATIRMDFDTAILGGTGIPMIKTNIGVFDPETGDELGFNEEGELAVLTDSHMIGYYGEENDTSQVLKMHKDGTIWAHSGDLGYIDMENNQVVVTDRITRTIFVYPSEKVYPTDIEEKISSISGVDAVSIISVADPYHEDFKVPVCVLVVNEMFDKEQVKKEINDLCISIYPEYAHPREIYFKDNLPLSIMQKTDVKALEKEFNEVMVLSRTKKN